MAKVITLGELMARLSPPGHSRFLQADSFAVNYGGAEANVAVSLAQLGHQVAFVSKLPSHGIGDAAMSALQKNGVDVSAVVRGEGRLGIYYLENGASIRPSSVIYDRKDSAFARAKPEEFLWDKIWKDAELFHVSGITPVLSDSCARLTLEALKSAKAHGVTVSFDLNYRAKLWEKGAAEKQRKLREMMQYVDICFGNALDAAKCLGYSEDGYDFLQGDYQICVSKEHMKNVLSAYHFKYLVTTLRESISASDNGWSAAVCDGNTRYEGKKYALRIIDRVGSGDAFAAGFLHGYLKQFGMEKSLEFAIAAAAVKHTIPGDFNYIKEEEVLSLMSGDGCGRVQR